MPPAWSGNCGLRVWLTTDNRNGLRVRISAGYTQAEEDSLIKEVLTKAESKDSYYYEFEVN